MSSLPLILEKGNELQTLRAGQASRTRSRVQGRLCQVQIQFGSTRQTQEGPTTVQTNVAKVVGPNQGVTYTEVRSLEFLGLCHRRRRLMSAHLYCLQHAVHTDHLQTRAAPVRCALCRLHALALPLLRTACLWQRLYTHIIIHVCNA